MLFLSDRKQRKKYERFIRPHVDSLYSLACRLSGNPHDAEDITQDLLVKLFDQTGKLYALDNPRPYLMRALFNQYVDYMRKQGRHLNTRDTDIDNELASPESAHATPEIAVDADLSAERLDAALARLSDDHRAIILLHDAEGFTFDEISDMLQIPSGTAKSRHNRARRALQTSLAQGGAP